MNLVIRKAKDTESDNLTSISFASKRYWNYPEEYLKVWEKELTITTKYIQENIVFVADADDMAVGYFSIVEVKEDFWAGQVFVKKGFWLEHIFIMPEFIGKRIGSELIAYAKDYCKKNKIERLNIFSDPYAKGFYDKIGAKYIKESPSSINGRTVSLYELAV